MRRFQSTRPRGARLEPHSCAARSRPGFNPRARVGRDMKIVNLIQGSQVSIHAPAWGATYAAQDAAWAAACFNPRARVGRDRDRIHVHVHAVVSIHAPAWGATSKQATNCAECKVSIHAPAWGATRAPFAPGGPDSVFQSTRPRGARREGGAHVVKVNWFQSTRPRGARLKHSTRCGSLDACFNPRARVGRDVLLSFQPVGHRRVSIHAPAWGATCDARRFAPRETEVSIHAPAWGATPMTLSVWPAKIVSIHAPAWGATHGGGVEVKRRRVSIHAPAWGATFFERRDDGHHQFQSTRPRGARPIGARRMFGYSTVSIHAPAWGATGAMLAGSSATMVSIHAPAWGATSRFA